MGRRSWGGAAPPVDSGAAPGTASASLLARLPGFCFVLLVFNVFIGFWPVFLSGAYGGAELLDGGGDAVRQVSFAGVFLLVAATSVHRHGAAALWNVPLPLLVVLGWCWLSVGWAVEPSVAARRILFTSMVVLSTVWSINMLSYRGVLTVIGLWFATILVADWLAVALFTQALHQPDELDRALIGNWRGIHSHKNEAGAFCALAAIVFLDASIRGRSRIIGPLLTVAACAFLFMTQSKTSTGFLVVAAVLAGGVVLCFRNPALRIGFLVGGLCAGPLLLAAYGDGAEDLVAAFDDPSSLTGRVQIWPVLFRYAANHVLLGSGYGSFWAIGDSSPIFEYDAGWLTTITHAHNGYIDMLVQIGLVGATLSVVSLVVWPLHLLLSRPLPPAWSRWLLAAILLFCWLHNLLETSFLDRANIVWVMMVLAYCLLQRGVVQGRFAAA